MKKTFFALLTLLGLLFASVGTAFAGTAIELTQVRNDEAGPTFIFRVSGSFSADELNSFVKVQGGDRVPMYCRQLDDKTAICHAARTIGGKNVTIYFGGSKFWTKVPDRAPYCYKAWNSFWTNSWVNYGPICQDEPAEYGEIGYYTYNGQVWPVEFYDFDVSGNCSPDPVPYDGPAYYFPSCPIPAPLP
ncbi:MAG: hypothetical protein LC099_07470 [Anaerolineales bacterium]|nr:hypothetical protein [Anaerolineales bacterium]